MDYWIHAGVPLAIFGMLIVGPPSVWYFIYSTCERRKDRIRKIYAELVKEKLDVIKTALAMGHSTDEIHDLDKRLEELIGTEKMLKTLKMGKSDSKHEAELQNVDLIDEVDRLANSKAKEGK